jgi:hypothetical protein
MLIYKIIVTPYYVIYYNIMVNIPMCYSNSTIVNIYWHCRKLVYKIIVNKGGYKITYFVASYRVYSPYIYIYIYIIFSYIFHLHCAWIAKHPRSSRDNSMMAAICLVCFSMFEAVQCFVPLGDCADRNVQLVTIYIGKKRYKQYI